MADDILSKLDLSGLADNFNDFLAERGLGDMNPSMAGKYKDAVNTSPMDDVLNMYGYDIESLFRTTLPEISNADDNPGNIPASIQESTANAVDSFSDLGFTEGESMQLADLLANGKAIDIEDLPANLQSLINTGINVPSARDFLIQIGTLHSLFEANQLLSEGVSFVDLIADMMADLGTQDIEVLVNRLSLSPLILKDIIQNKSLSVSKPLGDTISLLTYSNPFSDDPLIGTSADETLVASNAGGSRLVGAGGRDLFLIPVNAFPFSKKTTIEDFDPLSGSKIVLDISGYNAPIGKGLKFSDGRKTPSRLLRSKCGFAFDSKTKSLILNSNGKQSGFGPAGGFLLEFIGDSTPTFNDLLLYKDGLIMDLKQNYLDDFS